MARLMISTVSKGIVLLNTETRGYTPKHKDINALGLCKYGDTYLVAHRQGAVYVLDQTFNVVDKLVDKITTEQEGNGLNFHDLLVINDKLFIVESETNSIQIHDVTNGKYLDSINLFKEDAERFHLNCMKYYNGKLYLSMHYFDPTELATESLIENVPAITDADKVINEHVRMKYPTGGVVQLDPETFIVEKLILNGLGQPHSIVFLNDDFYIADSLRHKVVNAKRQEVMDCGIYYPRGMTTDGKNIFIGMSSMRHGVLVRNAASIKITDTNFNVLDEIILKGIDVTEIYDIITI